MANREISTQTQVKFKDIEWTVGEAPIDPFAESAEIARQQVQRKPLTPQQLHKAELYVEDMARAAQIEELHPDVASEYGLLRRYMPQDEDMPGKHNIATLSDQQLMLYVLRNKANTDDIEKFIQHNSSILFTKLAPDNQNPNDWRRQKINDAFNQTMGISQLQSVDDR